MDWACIRVTNRDAKGAGRTTFERATKFDVGRVTVDPIEWWGMGGSQSSVRCASSRERGNEEKGGRDCKAAMHHALLP